MLILRSIAHQPQSHYRLLYNMPSNYFAYIRVSTAKQGEKGVSLQEQRDAISRYAERHHLFISQWFEERVTAAKRGRLVFAQMLKLLRTRKAQGVIIHKIDRSARNLRDWADLGELIDSGVEIHFANESLDLNTRGGRLSADIQAVVAADYIRNLREETVKGFYGRIKQGILPLPAPVGYLDQGRGKAKIFDPERAPLVKLAFELYATGRYNLELLGEEIYRRGLTNRKGSRITRNGLSVMLNNPFYLGFIRLKRTKETFPGAHEPLIKKSLFDRVQLVLSGKVNPRSLRHSLVFSRQLSCARCKYSLIGERQKQFVYYRCHSSSCSTTCVREDKVEAALLSLLRPLQLSDTEIAHSRAFLAEYKTQWESHRHAQVEGLRLKLAQATDRILRLTDAFIDRLIERDVFEMRKSGFLMEQREIEDQLERLDHKEQDITNHVLKILELGSSAYLQYKTGFPDEKRELLQTLTSNRLVHGKTLEFTLSFPFREVANRHKYSHGGPQRYGPRTLMKLLKKLTTYCIENPNAARCNKGI
jgi:site-specific DNA recombinase